MASPVGHGLLGYAIGRFGEREAAPSGRLFVAACTAFAIAPDLDFLPGIAIGQPALHHQGASHSLIAGLGLSVVAALLLRRGTPAVAVLFAAYGSHLVLDFFGPDGRPPLGIPLFWPFSDATFLSPRPLLAGIAHSPATSASTDQWLVNVMSWRNVWAIALEVAVATPLLLAAELRRQRRKAAR